MLRQRQVSPKQNEDSIASLRRRRRGLVALSLSREIRDFHHLSARRAAENARGGVAPGADDRCLRNQGLSASGVRRTRMRSAFLRTRQSQGGLTEPGRRLGGQVGSSRYGGEMTGWGTSVPTSPARGAAGSVAGPGQFRGRQGFVDPRRSELPPFGAGSGGLPPRPEI
jgi:hypothetical protein